MGKILSEIHRLGDCSLHTDCVQEIYITETGFSLTKGQCSKRYNYILSALALATPTSLCFDLYLYSAYAAHYVYTVHCILYIYIYIIFIIYFIFYCYTICIIVKRSKFYQFTCMYIYVLFRQKIAEKKNVLRASHVHE